MKTPALISTEMSSRQAKKAESGAQQGVRSL
jgi:hypothetical protein